MHFMLTTLKVVYVLTTPMPELVEDATVEAIRIRAKWENDDYICRGHILNGMSDSLFDVYTNVESAKELWDSLESKYMAEDSSSKKFLVSNFNNYKMVDSRPVMEQYNELLRILGQYTQHGLKMDESISVSSIIDKLPPSWKDFKHTLKHGKYDLSLVQLGSHLRIEESLRAQDDDKSKGKEVGGPSTCHFKRDCRSGKKNNANAGGSRKGFKDHSQDQGQNLVHVWNNFVKYYVSLIFEAFYVQVDAIAWWIDSGRTTHVCKDRCWFKTYEPVEDGSVLYMADEHCAPVHGKGSVTLEFSSGKTITLFNVLYVPKLRKNLVSGPVLIKCGYKQVYESDKYILSKCGVFVGFGYYNNGMFMLNLNKVPDDSDSVYMSSSNVVNSSLWHARLGHAHYKRMLEMSKDDLIYAIDENSEKCTTCMLTKIARKPFQSITRKPVILELIHSDLCDFHATPSLGNKKAVVRLPGPKRKTLGEKSIDCIFVGYVKHSKAYRFYVIEPNDSVSINSIKESRDAIFDENYFSSIPRPKDIIPNVQESQLDDHIDDVPSEILEPRKGKRVRKAKSYGSNFQLYLVEGSRDQVGSQYSYCFSIDEDPRTYNEAMQSHDAAFWKEAIDDGIGSIMENYTWVLSNLPHGCKPLGCKWIFKREMKVDGTIDKFKAGLVIQGFRQKEGIDYFDTYAPVARITTIRLLLALVAIHNLVIHQLDVKTSFLNGDLDKEVYMKQPEGFVMPGNEHKVCNLVKSLYGLKQAPKQWHQKFDEVVLSSSFHLNQSDKCVYSKFDNSGKGVIICLYVNDILIFRTNQNQVDKTKKFLSSKFSMKDMGEVDVILGIKIKRENKGIVIIQSHYIEKILKKFNREDCSPVSTLMDPVEKLKPNTGKLVDQLEYSRAIGCLMYAMTSTRPNIAYAIGRLSRFTSNPSRQHWKAIMRVFNYLRGTKDYGLSYVRYPLVLEGYSDASWINHVEDSSSTSGWVAPTMARAYSQIYNRKSRYLGVRHSMVRELIRNGVLTIEFVRTQHNLADHLTKGLARDLVNISSIQCGKLIARVWNTSLSSRGARSKGTTYMSSNLSWRRNYVGHNKYSSEAGCRRTRKSSAAVKAFVKPRGKVTDNILCLLKLRCEAYGVKAVGNHSEDDELELRGKEIRCRLEDPVSEEVKEFVKKQVELTEFVLKKCETRERRHDKLTKSYDYPNFGDPFREAGKLEMFHWLLTRKAEEQFNNAEEVSGVMLFCKITRCKIILGDFFLIDVLWVEKIILEVLEFYTPLLEDSQANIKISPPNNNYIGVNERLVMVIGTLQQLMQAVNLILLKLSEAPYNGPNYGPPGSKGKFQNNRFQNNKVINFQINFASVHTPLYHAIFKLVYNILVAVSRETRKILIKRAANINMPLDDVSIAIHAFGRECRAAIEAKQMVAYELEKVG
ncbi:zinc finger, CCHC-type containing protein [Tanacetum coccineum]